MSILIKVKVFPEADENLVIKKSDDSYVVKVKEKREKGLANQRVKSLLALYFMIQPNKVRLVKGGKKQNKIFEIN